MFTVTAQPAILSELLCILGAEGCVVDVNRIFNTYEACPWSGALQGAIRIDRNLQCVYIVCGIPINLQQQNKDFVFKAFREIGTSPLNPGWPGPRQGGPP